MSKKTDQKWRTIIVWNDTRIAIRKCAENIADTYSCDLREMLHGEMYPDDERWQVIDGLLMVDADEERP